VTLLAFSLILIAAVLHATWNLLAKRAGGGAGFVWLFSALSALIYAPLGIATFIIRRPSLGGVELLFIAGSGLLHLVYFVLLQRGYRIGDLSLIYPLARGTGPTLSTIAAIAFLSERPSPLAIAGALLVVGSVFVMTGGTRLFRQQGAGLTIGYGLLTGTVIASYTLWDKYAVATLLIPPLLFDWSMGLFRTAMLAPAALRQRQQVASLFRVHWREALGVATLSPLAYILVLTALVSSPVSYVAPAREISILIGAFFGARLLREGDAPRRLAAAGTMVVGVIALAVG
jgi:drug/metabolite transporter (DMT)-like permease